MCLVLIILNLTFYNIFYNTSLLTLVAGQTSSAVQMHYFGKNIGHV